MARQKSTEAAPAVTPLMAQYAQVKGKYPDAMLLFRVGDFYETFGEDAVKAARALGITLTSRNNGGSDVELAGFPFHALDMYLPRLVRAGFRVAICEQMEKPVPGKVVRRSVTEVITPGVTTVESLLEHNRNNYLCTVAFGGQHQFGLAFLDISTGEFFVSEANNSQADKLLQGLKPSEVVLPKSRQKEFVAAFGDKFYLYALEDWIFTRDFGREKLLQHFKTSTLKGYGVEHLPLGQMAAGAALHYLAATENTRLAHITNINRLPTERYVWLDPFTIRNLELVAPVQEGGKSLLQVLDHTVSPMGARLLKKWVLLPLIHLAHIQERQDMVAYSVAQSDWAESLTPLLRQVGDLERLLSKATLGKVNPREMGQLLRALYATEQVQQVLQQAPDSPFVVFAEQLQLCLHLRQTIEKTLADDLPTDARKGGVITVGANAELDELRDLVQNSREKLLDLQQREAERTGITGLKVGFNSVFGYYLEVTSKWKQAVPADWIRKQTIANGERYITPALKELEQRILTAEEKIGELEVQLFQQLVESVHGYIQPLQLNAQLMARLDCVLSFAKAATLRQYVRPTVDNSLLLDIRSGRHPVIETQLPVGETYVPNDVYLDNEEAQIMMITGPNMAGKSALLRQTALIALMAQMGSFVPAEQARLGLIDKVFTRVGANDNISAGESTFMVEMNETALIMNNISERSLILLDEIGRGTSTYDGISIAWSIAEYLHNNDRAHPKTLFATHYHELNELADTHSRIHNYHVSTRQAGQKVIFLRKLTPGGSNHSFGIHVAEMAGMPAEVVERAQAILQTLETLHLRDEVAVSEEKPAQTPHPTPARPQMKAVEKTVQLQIFEADDYTRRLRDELSNLDLNTMTPIDALWKLNELVKLAKSK